MVSAYIQLVDASAPEHPSNFATSNSRVVASSNLKLH